MDRLGLQVTRGRIGFLIACFDVYYRDDSAKACSLVFTTKPQEEILSSYCTCIETPEDYIPGEFYKRELPCILRVFEMIREEISLAIIDGFVMLDSGRKGLGMHLYEKLDRSMPVVGVAKTLYKGCTDYLPVYRGNSKKPLYVSSAGMDSVKAASIIQNLEGENRIPNVLKQVDLLTRENP